MSLISELRRRNVLRMAEISERVLEMMQEPEWAPAK